MYQNYKDFLQKHVNINQLEWSIIKSKLQIVEYKKGDIIHNIGDICKNLLFINSGLARVFIIDENGKDNTWSICFNDKNSHMTNLFVVDFDSFINQTPSKLEIEALSDCQMVSVDFSDINFIYKNTKKGNIIGRLMAQEAYSYLHNFIIVRQTQSAKERFNTFMKETPHLIDKVSQYHIATLLGITPQHLSRLKKDYCTNY